VSSKGSNRSTKNTGKLVVLSYALQQFREQCGQALESAIKKAYPDWTGSIPRLSVPPNLAFGELSSSIAHEVARELRLPPHDVAVNIMSAVELQNKGLIAGVEELSGYVNFKLNYELAATLILGAVSRETQRYGIITVPKPLRISVEHTSANPSGPLTMGHARNSILGDALARILRARGHIVNRRFYVDDVGRQVSILAYGYKLLKKPKPQGKVDNWFGRLYACTSCALELETAKRKIRLLGDELSDERNQLQQTLDDWVTIAAELEVTDKDLLQQAIQSIQNQSDPDGDVQEIGRSYERKEKDTSALIREVAGLCLEGIKTTLSQMDIYFDTWDWESQLIWEKKVERELNRLLKLPFVRSEGQSVTLDIDAIVEAYSLREAFHLSETYEVPPLTLVRSDGTTLYPMRDIAYTTEKFLDSERVINVIASEQSLPQLQIRIALYALDEREAAKNLIHYAYGLVELPGVKMSKRRARYITLDEVIEQSRSKVDATVSKRREELGREANEIVQSIALGAIKFAMLSLNGMKNLTFTWDRVLSLERNSLPFINYAYTRAGSILRKAGLISETTDFSCLKHPLERLLILRLGQMPEVFVEAADQLKPEELASYANSVAEKFHEYYEKVDVIHADDQVKNARAILVGAVQNVLRSSMELLGIKLSERM
jgi:arginyl-tRNA synthetase